MEAQAAAAEEEDLFEVLQRRIEAQRSELREGRESIENVMKSEVGPHTPSSPPCTTYTPHPTSHTPHPTPCIGESKRDEERGGVAHSLKPCDL